MPLNILKHKSWNPYSSAAIARVQGDEAAIRAATDTHSAAVDAYEAQLTASRLRGLPEPETPPSLDDFIQRRLEERRRENRDKFRDRRDSPTDQSSTGASTRRPEKEVSLVGKDGHIQLITPDESSSKRRKSDTKRTSDFQSDSPWYSTSKTSLKPAPSRDDDDQDSVREMRKAARQQARLNSNDPLSAMRNAQRVLKSSDRHSANRELAPTRTEHGHRRSASRSHHRSDDRRGHHKHRHHKHH